MKKVVVFLLAFTFLACKEQKKQEKSINNNQTVTLHVLDGGTVIANKLEIFSEEGQLYQGQQKTFANAFYVVKHPKGILVWDTGLPENLVGMPEPFTDQGGYFTVSRKDSLVNQLQSIGLRLDDVDYLALSHTHFDHVGAAANFTNATWLVQKNEYDFITSDDAKTQAPDSYNAVKNLKKVIKLDGDYDVFGDGKVVIKYMPGHTIGHQVLFIDIGKERPILLTGDLYHFKENRDNKVAPSFNYNIEQTKESMELFEEFAQKTNAHVIIQHSPEDFKKLQELIKQ